MSCRLRDEDEDIGGGGGVCRLDKERTALHEAEESGWVSQTGHMDGVRTGVRPQSAASASLMSVLGISADIRKLTLS